MAALMTPPVRSSLGAGLRETLADPALRRALVAMVRRRVPEAEVEEIVQATLTEALAARAAPEEPEAVRRWVHGIARHKVVDFHRSHRHDRQPHVGGDALDAVPADSAPHDAVDLLRWAERELPETQGGTLEWMLREGHGEKLEEIAHEAALPAPQVRQRVARLRKHFRTRWAAQLAAAAALLAFAILAAVLYRRSVEPEAKKAVPEIAPDPIARALELRKVALSRCQADDWEPCLRGLDEAAKLDPAGDSAEAIVRAREAARLSKQPTPAPSSSAPAPQPSPVPTLAPVPTLTKPPSKPAPSGTSATPSAPTTKTTKKPAGEAKVTVGTATE